MPRRKKDTAVPPDKIEGKVGAAAPDPRLISTLDQRAQALAQAQKQRKRMALDVPPPMYDRILTLAERWDEPLMVVMRAALEAGLSQLIEFPGDPRRSPFAAGAPTPRTPGQIDPRGNQFPPPGITGSGFGAVTAPQPFAPLPPPIEYTETAWTPAPLALPAWAKPSSGAMPDTPDQAYEAPAPPTPKMTVDDFLESPGDTVAELVPGEKVAENTTMTMWKDPFADDDAKIQAAIAEASAPDDDVTGLL